MAETFIDLFAGAGGLSWGLASAGLDCTLASDYFEDAIQTYSLNMPNHPAIVADIRQLDPFTLLDSAGGRPDWIVGGPPCQGYSTVGKRNRNDPRNVLFLEFRRMIEKIKPPGFIIENVLGMRDMKFEDSVAESFRELGYTVNFMVLTSADFGVPQLRRRVVFIGHRERGLFLGPPKLLSPIEYTTVADAISDLPPLGPGETNTEYTGRAKTDFQRTMRGKSKNLQGHTVSKHPPHLVEAISHISDGGNRTEIPDHLQPKSGFHNSYSRLASWKPAVAITQNLGKPSGTRCIHPKQHRGLTTREGARLQSFPDRFHFAGKVTSQRLQVGNAVPPLLAEAVGRAVLDSAHWE